MLKVIIFWTAISGPAYRHSDNVYSVPGYGTVETNNCTVSAHGELDVTVTRDWLYFYDRDGNLEADCQRLTKNRPTVSNEKLTIRRPIATR